MFTLNTIKQNGRATFPGNTLYSFPSGNSSLDNVFDRRADKLRLVFLYVTAAPFNGGGQTKLAFLSLMENVLHFTRCFLFFLDFLFLQVYSGLNLFHGPTELYILDPFLIVFTPLPPFLQPQNRFAALNIFSLLK